MDPARDRFAALALDQSYVVLTLQIEPELRPVAEVATQAHRGVGGDGAASVQNVRNPARRHTEVQGQPVGA
jgi:hypothetical protein